MSMLTCEEIAARAAEISPIINRQTYDAVAERIHPKVKMLPSPMPLSKADLLALHDTPEWHEAKRGNHWTSHDWTAMVVMCVTLDQYRALVWRRLVELGHVAEVPV